MQLLSSMVRITTLLNVVIHQPYGMVLDNMRTAEGSGRVATLAECRLAVNACLRLLQQPNYFSSLHKHQNQKCAQHALAAIQPLGHPIRSACRCGLCAHRFGRTNAAMLLPDHTLHPHAKHKNNSTADPIHVLDAWVNAAEALQGKNCIQDEQCSPNADNNCGSATIHE
jgi:hypothetical protein